LLALVVRPPDLRIDGWVLVTELEDRHVVWLKLLVRVSVGSGPLVVVEWVIEYLRVENTCHCHVLVQKVNQVVLEQMGVDVRILVLHDIVDH
jgi:hypothetical protein